MDDLIEVPFGSFEVISAHRQTRAIHQAFFVGRIERKGLVEEFEGSFAVAERFAHQRTASHGLDLFGFDFQSFIEVSPCAIVLAEHQKVVSTDDKRDGVFGVDFENGREFGDCFIDPTEFRIGLGKSVASREVVRVELDGPQKQSEGFFVILVKEFRVSVIAQKSGVLESLIEQELRVGDGSIGIPILDPYFDALLSGDRQIGLVFDDPVDVLEG